MLPKDPYLLLSVINTKLRDCGGCLKELCDDLDECLEQIKETLKKINYEYDEILNQFIQK